jgi:arginase
MTQSPNLPSFTLLGAPINSAGRFTGVERMPAALRAAGLVERLGLRDQGDLPTIIDDAVRDPQTGLIGFRQICAASALVRGTVGELLARGERPLVLGGDCTVLIGITAALRDQVGRTALAFVDGHLDFYDGLSSPTGETADMDLAILSGLGPAGLIDLAGPPPLLAPADIIVLGCRDEAQAARDGAPDPRQVAPKMAIYDAETLRHYGCGAAGASVEERFRFDPGHFWLHLDLDVLDATALPAVDYRMTGGLGWEEVAKLVRPLAQSPVLLGMDVTIYNPTLDPSGDYARQIVELLARILSSAA